MAKFYMQVLGLLLLVSFCIFFGIDAATKGMENVQGYTPAQEAQAPVRQESASPSPTPASANKPVQEVKTKPSPTPTPIPLPVGSAEHKAGNQIGDMLQKVSSVTIKSVVGIFEGIFGS